MTTETPLPSDTWFLLHCKSRQEPRALANLTEQGYVCFFPTIRLDDSSTAANGLASGARLALFPGYMFVRLSPNSNWHGLRSTRGVLRIVGFNNRPYPVSNVLIEQIRARCDGYRALEAGDRVQVKIGWHTRIDAIFLASDGSERAVLLLNLLNQECRLTVPDKAISRLSAQ